MTMEIKGPFSIPAIRGEMGDWTYYAGAMPMGEIAARVSEVALIHEPRNLGEYIQRSLGERAPRISDYLVKHESRFFSSIVIGCYSGDPDWNEVDVDPANPLTELLAPARRGGAPGFLTFTGGETLFAMDGQHRVAGIKLAVKKNEDLATELVPVLVVSASVYKDRVANPEGLRRTRRLFTHLNKYAKPVGAKDKVALDEDDIGAIITRRIVDEYEPFSGKIAKDGNATNIPADDTRHLTSIVSLHDFLSPILAADLRGVWKAQGHKTWNNFLLVRPDEPVEEKFYERAVYILEQMRHAFPQVDEVARLTKPDIAVAQLRSKAGGHLLARPLGWGLLREGLLVRMALGDDLKAAMKFMSGLPWELGQPPWKGLLFDPAKGTMVMSGGSLAKGIVRQWAGQDARAPAGAPAALRGKTGWSYLAAKYADTVGVDWQDAWRQPTARRGRKARRRAAT